MKFIAMSDAKRSLVKTIERGVYIVLQSRVNLRVLKWLLDNKVTKQRVCLDYLRQFQSAVEICAKNSLGLSQM